MAEQTRNCLLLVEDDVLVRMTVALMLEDDGFKVVEAGDAAEAMRLAEGGLDIPVMITDVDLGAGANGMELANQMRAVHPEMAVVFITGRPQSLAGHLLGPRDAVLPKPFEGSALSQLVARLVG